jgi:hypothetical protein
MDNILTIERWDEGIKALCKDNLYYSPEDLPSGKRLLCLLYKEYEFIDVE